MATPRAPQAARLTVEPLEGREVPCTTPWTLEPFEQTNFGALPPGWQQHSSDATSGFAASPVHALASDTGLRTDGQSNSETRAWSDAVLPADARVGADVYLD